jgi:hypothetical protein
MLHIEPTGEVFQSKVWAANGRELRQVCRMCVCWVGGE